MRKFSWIVILVGCLTCNLVKAEDLVTYSWGFPLQGEWWELIDEEDDNAWAGQQIGAVTKPAAVNFDTPVFSPCSGVVKVSDNMSFDGLGALSPGHSQYRGFALIIECLNDSDEEYYLVILQHLQSGSGFYDADKHQGLAPVGSVVYKGQYVARVNHYWIYGELDWPHLRFSLRHGYFKPEDLSNLMSAFYYPRWPEFDLEKWLDPTQFIIEHSMKAQWFSDGSLIQVYGQRDVDQIIEQEAHNIYAADAFAANNFEPQKILYVTASAYKCVPKGEWQIEWTPWREVLLFDGTYYLLEKNCPDCSKCILSDFASPSVVKSWNLDIGKARELSEAEAFQWFNYCDAGETLYLRDGAVVALKSDAKLPETFYVAHHNGYLSAFATVKNFWLSGYDYDDVQFFDKPLFFENAFKDYGEAITEEQLMSCQQKAVLINSPTD